MPTAEFFMWIMTSPNRGIFSERKSVAMNVKKIPIFILCLGLGILVLNHGLDFLATRKAAREYIVTRPLDASKLKQYFACAEVLPRNKEIWLDLSESLADPVLFVSRNREGFLAGTDVGFILVREKESLLVPHRPELVSDLSGTRLFEAKVTSRWAGSEGAYYLRGFLGGPERRSINVGRWSSFARRTEKVPSKFADARATVLTAPETEAIFRTLLTERMDELMGRPRSVSLKTWASLAIMAPSLIRAASNTVSSGKAMIRESLETCKGVQDRTVSRAARLWIAKI
jgi:hypothetical protein